MLYFFDGGDTAVMFKGYVETNADGRRGVHDISAGAVNGAGPEIINGYRDGTGRGAVQQ